jgi:hypothetical protein
VLSFLNKFPLRITSPIYSPNPFPEITTNDF